MASGRINRNEYPSGLIPGLKGVLAGVNLVGDES